MNKNKNIVGYIPNLLYRFYLKLKERFDPPRQVTQEEIYCFEICKKLIYDEDTKLTIAPVSKKRYIKNDKKHMFVVLEQGTITLVNHVYSYSVYCEYDENYLELIKLIDSELEKKRNDLENEIKSNIRNSLKNILEGLSS